MTKGDGVHELVQALEYLNLAVFVALAVVGVVLLRRRRDSASLWVLLAFAALAAIEILGQVSPTHPHGFGERALVRIEIAILLLFPYLIYRFTTAFRRPGRTAERLLGSMTVVMVVWTFAQPTYPSAGEPRSASFVAYLIGFLIHWTVLSAFSSWRLSRAGRGQPTVARRRMQLLAGAIAVLVVALFFVAATSSPNSPLQAVSQALAFVAALAFLLGLAPPAILRMAWRGPEQRRVQAAIESLTEHATRQEEMLERVLEPMAEIVGAKGIALRGRDGELLGAYNVSPNASEDDPAVLELEVSAGTLTVWTTPYAPFFGEEELRLLETLSALTGLALDRVRLYEAEHDARVGLERANEVMTSFITLAAHELRTPVTSIHGFVHTLNHLGDRLTPERRDEVSRTLEQQTARMAVLVEQLLDLSRLDAEAIEIHPQSLPVRTRIAELVATAAPDRSEQVSVDVADDLEAVVDPAAFDRIVSNLVTNAFRYGAPPVVVHADRTDRHFRVAVEDRGGGVPAEFVPDLFERFTRSDDSRERAVGTGLGLAIARSYARAHGGDLLYEPAHPHGARFQFVLPVAR
ncbi:MAG TPA: HAMP domain-containing sensor histidine kinase [Gaiellaceae bacterium]|nr:HAMP domain-containing sensor histidine kinase [Gaiellaceae bacterium]